jgi:hypothetical protein
LPGILLWDKEAGAWMSSLSAFGASCSLWWLPCTSTRVTHFSVASTDTIWRADINLLCDRNRFWADEIFVSKEPLQILTLNTLNILSRIDPLLSSDSANSCRYYVTPATYTHATIE